MKELLTNKDSLSKLGYCVIRNLLSEEEIKKCRSIMTRAHETTGNGAMLVSDYRESWPIIFNDRVLDALKSALGPNIFFLHDAYFLNTKKITKEADYTEFSSWHRDSPCRQFGKGPDWDQNVPYSVVTAIIYLSPNEETNSGVNLISFSHKKRFTVDTLLRLIHYKIKKISYLQIFKKLLEKFIGVNIRTDPGDCVIFFANLFHRALPNRAMRQAICMRYGADNKHSKNYLNFIFNYRKDSDYTNNDDQDKKRIDDFFNLLKNKDIFYPLPEKKEDLDGAHYGLEHDIRYSNPKTF